MISISQLILERKLYPLVERHSKWKDSLLANVMESGEEERAFITVGSPIRVKFIRERIEKEYHIIGVYQLGKIFANTSTSFYIVHLSKTPSTGIRFSVFSGKCFERKRKEKYSRKELATPDKYKDEWNAYIQSLESWLNGGDIPQSNNVYEFKYISRKELFHDSLFPETYSSENIRIRTLLDKQDTAPLSELADIVAPRYLFKSDKKGKVLGVRDLHYPLVASEIEESRATDVVLQNGDIVLPGIRCKTTAYLFKNEGSESIYASSHMVVIRAKKVSPEYLYLYLNSEVVIKAINARRYEGIISRLNPRELTDLPVEIPKRPEEEYTAFFDTLVNEEERRYDLSKRIGQYIDGTFTDREKQEETVEDILNIEVAYKIKAHYEEQLRTFLTDDLKELNACFNAKAYKATLILAGSILEAVLIDWLSEIKGINFFKKQYMVKDKRKGGKKPASLYDYIDEIKYIERPYWMEEARKAHEIRDKRNLVHAKLSLKADNINERVCRQVIQYLKDVITTRGVNS